MVPNNQGLVAGDACGADGESADVIGRDPADSKVPTEVDQLGPGRSRVTCSGRFDLPEGASADLVKGAIESVYNSIVHDIAITAAQRRALR